MYDTKLQLYGNAAWGSENMTTICCTHTQTQRHGTDIDIKIARDWNTEKLQWLLHKNLSLHHKKILMHKWPILTRTISVGFISYDRNNVSNFTLPSNSTLVSLLFHELTRFTFLVCCRQYLCRTILPTRGKVKYLYTQRLYVRKAEKTR